MGMRIPNGPELLAKLAGQRSELDYIGVIRQRSACLDRLRYDEDPAGSSRVRGRKQADLDMAASVVQLADGAWYEGRDGHAPTNRVPHHLVVIPEEAQDHGPEDLAIDRIDAG